MKYRLTRFLLFLIAFSVFLTTFAAAEEVGVTSGEVDLKLPCKSAVLIEQTTGQILYEQNPDEKLPIASVTKIMTLLLTMEALDQGIISLTDNVPISELAASMGGSQVFLEPGEVISLDDVLKAVFVSSANDGAVALAELISGSFDGFVAAMNEKAAALGMHNTIFYNPTGLDDGDTNLSSARDIAKMSAALLSYEKTYDYTTIWIDSIRNGAFGLSNTNKLVRFYPGATGLKTGSTDKAKFCVSASAERNGLKLCAVVLAGESSADRFTAAKTMLDYGFASYAFYQPESPDLSPLKVWGGKEDFLLPVSDQKGFLLPKSESVGISSAVELPLEIQAPVEKGQVLGKIVYKRGDTVIREIPLCAEKGIPALTYLDVVKKLLLRFFSPQV